MSVTQYLLASSTACQDNCTEVGLFHSQLNQPKHDLFIEHKINHESGTLYTQPLNINIPGSYYNMHAYIVSEHQHHVVVLLLT